MVRVAFLHGGIAFLFMLKDGIIDVINSGGTAKTGTRGGREASL